MEFLLTKKKFELFKVERKSFHCNVESIWSDNVENRTYGESKH